MNINIPDFFNIKKNIRIRRNIKKRFFHENNLMRGKLSSNSANQSVLFFTVHRCASRYVKSILNQLAGDAGMYVIDIEPYFWFGGELHVKPDRIYKEQGYIYGPFMNGIPLNGSPNSLSVLPKYKIFIDKMKSVPIHNLDKFKIVLMLRDPRDVLTSYYFHHAFQVYENPAHNDIVKERRKDALSKTIDEYVLEQAPVFLKRYQVYLTHLIGRPNTLLLRYEDMIGDTKTWLNKLHNVINPNGSKNTVKSIIEEANFKVSKEKADEHKRQVTPGDHKAKLKDETITSLNNQFKEVLKELGYEY